MSRNLHSSRPPRLMLCIGAALTLAACGFQPAMAVDEIGVKAVSAIIKPTQANGDSWDTLDAPDVFIEYITASGSKYTEQRETLQPLWNQGFTYPTQELTTTGLTLRVWDYDSTSVNEPITDLRTVILTQQDITRGRLDYANWGQVQSITFMLVRN